jgi:acyl-CoA thioesterase I
LSKKETMNTFLLSFLKFLVLASLLGACSEKKTSEATQTPIDTAVKDTTSLAENKKTILFFGNSLTAGYGVEPSQAFPSLIQQRIDSLNLPYKIVNAGLSGETTAAGKNRIDWLLKEKFEVFVLELGANDALRGINLKESRQNLKEILRKVKEKYPDVRIVIAGMEVPPNMGADYAKEFRSIFKDLAEEYKAVLIPFLLDKVGGEPKLNVADGIHPNAEGHKIVTETVWKALKTVLL